MNPQSHTDPLPRARFVALLIGLAGLTGCVIGWILEPRQFYISYLAAVLLWVGISLGSLAWLMIHFLTGGRWGFPLRRFFEASARLLPLGLLFFIPIFFGLRDLYPWADPQRVAANDVLKHKHIFINEPGYVIRTVVLFALWSGIAFLLTHWSREQDRTPNPGPTKKARRLSGPGLVIYPVTGTFAFVDWIMSLEPDWYSTMFPILICIGQMLSALTFGIVLLAWFAPRTALAEITGRENFHHLGSLLLALTMMWAYMAFGQLLIVWSGDLPHEISWYLHRTAGGWRWIVIFIFLFHFLVPFFLLLSRKTKRSVVALTTVASAIFLAHVVEVWWLVTPAFYQHGFHFSWLDFAAVLGLGGLWGVCFSLQLQRVSLIPLNDPRFAMANT